MKRFHVHVAVEDLAAATRFYAGLFGQPPSVARPDYAKWMLDDPRVNFAISTRARAPGLAHLGIQVDSADELAEVHSRLEAAGETLHDKGTTTCCYAESDKGWVIDPQGIAWETFFTHGEATTYGRGAVPPGLGENGCGGGPAAAEAVPATEATTACCAPRACG
jgi:catechol 2,3-dioxygenase-like lactoylglutathione lyase family enzyme